MIYGWILIGFSVLVVVGLTVIGGIIEYIIYRYNISKKGLVRF